MHIMATNWPLADKIDTCNDDLIVAITEIITGNKMSTKNHLILPVHSFELNLSELDLKKCGNQEMGPLFFLPSPDSPKRKERGPTRR